MKITGLETFLLRISFSGAAEAEIAAGENVASLHEFRESFLNGALDVAQPSVAKIGLTEARGAKVALPQKPGLGCEPDPDVVARYRIAD
jgi:L-alanine-DL-glutamate epimerase-like enolase superfamily enzyme